MLVILAGVRLIFVLGDNGIKKAQDRSDAYQNEAGEEFNALVMVNGYLENKLGNNTTERGETLEKASNSTSYVRCYADSDGDRTGSGTWNDNPSADHYEYSPVTEGLKRYSISSTNYTGFGGQ